jgi:outer membrane protein TolC
VSIALEENPLILSARENHRASRARINQAWAFEQPSLNYDSDLQPSPFDFAGSEESYLGISGVIPFPLRPYLSGRIAGKESAVALTEVSIAELEMTYQVTATFYRLLLARELADYAEQNFELSQDFVAQTELKLGAGDVPRMELIRAQVEAAWAATELRRAENDENLTRARMNFLLARPRSAALEISGELKAPAIDHSLDQLQAVALSSRPELAGIESSIQGMSLTKTLGYMSYVPDVELGVAKHRISGFDDTWQVTLSAQLPLFFWQPAIGEIREAGANFQALQQEAAHLRNLISLEVEQAHREYLNAVTQIELMESQILSQAEEVYEMYLFSYQQGEIGGIELIAAQRTLSEARRAYVHSLFDYDVAIASLEKAVGRTLGEN